MRALFLLAALAPAPAPKVAVLPFATLSRDAPKGTGEKAAALLEAALKGNETLSVLERTPPKADEGVEKALARAHEEVRTATEQRARHRFRDAQTSLQNALDDFDKGAADAKVADIQDAAALLSAVQYSTGQDEAGLASLTRALALAPARALPLAATSRLFSNLVEQIRRKVVAAAAGSLLLSSKPPGAEVSLDGQELGVTPVRVSGVPPGRHLWQMKLPSGEQRGGWVDAAGTVTAEVSDPAGGLLAGLASNRIDLKELASAREAAKALGADLLVFGALTRAQRNLTLDAFVLNAAGGQVRRLSRATFDAELLSAGVELDRLAGEVVRKGEGMKLPATVTEDRAGGAPPETTVRYAATLVDLDAPNPVPDTTKRKPLGK